MSAIHSFSTTFTHSQENGRVRNSTISLASTLSKKVSQLISALTPGKRRLSTEEGQADVLLNQMETAAGVMSAAKLLIHWLDHNPSTLIEDYDSFRNDVMMSALDLVAILVRLLLLGCMRRVVHMHAFIVHSKTSMIMLRCWSR